MHLHELDLLWDCVLPCSESMGCISCATERYSTERVQPSHTRMGGRLETLVPCRLKFIEAAEVLKTERIKLPADANIEVDDKCFPPVCLAKLKPGRSVQQVAAAPQGRPRRGRIVRVNFCGNCKRAGHTRSKCRFMPVWFDWDDDEDNIFKEA